MNKIIIFIVLILYFCIEASQVDFRPEKRISGGPSTQTKPVPWMVAIIRDDGRLCAGTLITHYHVLTSAYCAENSVQLELVLGAYNLSDPNESNLRLYSHEVYIHDEWNPKTFQNDIAIVKLPKYVQYNEKVGAAWIPDNEQVNWKGYVITIGGWGERSTNVGYSQTFQYIDTRGQDPLKCQNIFPKYFNSTNHFCIGGFKNRTMCEGDEGGPAIYDSFIEMTVIGVASFRMAQSCSSDGGSQYPAVYTIVWRYREWMKKIVKS